MTNINSFFKVDLGDNVPKSSPFLNPSPTYLKVDSLKKKQQVIWEYRIFWPQTKASVLLNLAAFDKNSFDKFKKLILNDVYLLVQNKCLNLKIRREKLIYKPLIEHDGEMHAYGYKQKFNFPIHWRDIYTLFPRLQHSAKLCLTVSDFQSYLQENGYVTDIVSFEKKVYRCQTEGGLQLELSEFHMSSQLWFSLCVEGLDYQLVKQVSTQLTQDVGEIMGYIEFLNKYKKH